MSIRSDIAQHIHTHGPSTAGALFENLKGLDDRKQLSNALYQMTQAGQLVQVDTEGGKAYALGPNSDALLGGTPAAVPKAAPTPRKATVKESLTPRPAAKSVDVHTKAREVHAQADANLHAYLDRLRENDDTLDALVQMARRTRELVEATAS